MNSAQFSCALKEQLVRLPRKEVKKWLEYYTEQILDRTEEGMSEEEAVADVGQPEEIAEQILADRAREVVSRPHGKLVWGLLGLPIWLPLLCAALAVFVCVLIVMWTLMLVCSVLALSLPFGAADGVFAAIYFNSWTGMLVYLGASCVCAGLSIPVISALKPVAKLSRKATSAFIRLATRFFRKGGDHI